MSPFADTQLLRYKKLQKSLAKAELGLLYNREIDPRFAPYAYAQLLRYKKLLKSWAHGANHRDSSIKARRAAQSMPYACKKLLKSWG